MRTCVRLYMCVCIGASVIVRVSTCVLPQTYDVVCVHPLLMGLPHFSLTSLTPLPLPFPVALPHLSLPLTQMQQDEDLDQLRLFQELQKKRERERQPPAWVQQMEKMSESEKVQHIQMLLDKR